VGAKNVFLLPMANGDFTREMGMLVRKSKPGFWVCVPALFDWWFNDGRSRKFFAEAGRREQLPQPIPSESLRRSDAWAHRHDAGLSR